MFTTEMDVNGKFVKGTIRKEGDKYKFTSREPAINDYDTYDEDNLTSISEEIKNVARELERLNKPEITYRGL